MRETFFDLQARDIMTRDIITVAQTATVRELAALLQEHQISGVPVVDARGRITGVVSASDALGAAGDSAAVAPETASPEFYVHGWEDKLNPDELRQLHIEDEGLLVSDIMTPRVYSVAADAPIAEVARLMVEARVHRLLVAEGGDLVGIVSTLDLLHALDRSRPSPKPRVSGSESIAD
jgi:CBS domain-containing protein